MTCMKITGKYSDRNKKVIGIPKDELNGKVIKEIIALKSKFYFIDCFWEWNNKRLKGVTKATIKRQVNFENTKDCLEKGKKSTPW